MEEKQEKKAKKIKLTTTGMLCLIFSVLIIGGTFAFIVRSAGEYSELLAEYERLQSLISAEERTQQHLEHQIAIFDRNAYIEQVARDRLGMARPNEIVFRNIAAD